MVLSERHYIYGISKEGEEFLSFFLCSELDKAAAKRYCERHAKVFRNRFSHYRYGMPSQDKQDWEVYNNE